MPRDLWVQDGNARHYWDDFKCKSEYGVGGRSHEDFLEGVASLLSSPIGVSRKEECQGGVTPGRGFKRAGVQGTRITT